jgi:hypothetical protein
MKRIATIAAAVLLVGGLSSCSEGTSAADTADENLSKAAENFEVPRRIVGINGITDEVLFSAEGFCSYETEGGTVRTICLVSRDPNVVERTTMHLSDNVTFVVTQMGGVGVDLFRPRVIFRPEGIVPNFDLSTGDSPTDTSGAN